MPTQGTLTNTGMVGLKSVYGRYLQAHYPDGEMHASNQSRNEEETWFLYMFDQQKQLYALMNWRNGMFINSSGGCAPANTEVLANSGLWIMISGAEYGAYNAVAFRSSTDLSLLFANSPGDDSSCGGEVYAKEAKGYGPPENDPNWVGWWVMEPASAPSPGKDFWNTVGGAISQFGQNILNKLSPADVGSIMKSLAGGAGAIVGGARGRRFSERLVPTATPKLAGSASTKARSDEEERKAKGDTSPGQPNSEADG